MVMNCRKEIWESIYYFGMLTANVSHPGFLTIQHQQSQSNNKGQSNHIGKKDLFYAVTRVSRGKDGTMQINGGD